MVAVKSIAPAPRGAPMGPPMGGMMGPPPAAPAAMPNTGGPMPMGGPGTFPTGGGLPMAPPSSGPQQLSNQGSLFGGSASGRAKFKGALGARKSAFMAKQQQMSQPVTPPSFGQFAGAPMGGGSMAPLPPLGGSTGSMLASGAPLGRIIGGTASVGSAPVQMMNGGVIPLFNGLGRY